METNLYQRIKELCETRGINITKLENELGFGAASIGKWKNSISPSVDKVVKVANYFNVSVDYLVGRTNLTNPISDLIVYDDIITIQKACRRMSTEDREKMMQSVRDEYGYAFPDKDRTHNLIED